VPVRIVGGTLNDENDASAISFDSTPKEPVAGERSDSRVPLRTEPARLRAALHAVSAETVLGRTPTNQSAGALRRAACVRWALEPQREAIGCTLPGAFPAAAPQHLPSVFAAGTAVSHKKAYTRGQETKMAG
jgi:hypothetical protein